MNAADWNGRDPEPGDVLVDEAENRTLVLAVERVQAYSRVIPQSCGCCVNDEPEQDQLTIWVAAEEPVEVILAGGGVTKVVGLEEWCGEPSTSKVMRPVEAFGHALEDEG